MSYDTVRDGIALIIKGLGYAESTELDDFEDASVHEYGNTFILRRLSGEMAEGPDGSENLADRFYDNQAWEVQIGFDKTKADYDDMQRRCDDILSDIDDPSNWSSFVRILKYARWEIRELESYFVLVIELKVIDTVTY